LTTRITARLEPIEPHVSNVWIARAKLPDQRKPYAIEISLWNDEFRMWGKRDPLPCDVVILGYTWRASIDDDGLVLEG
jgi:hypothetical protein